MTVTSMGRVSIGAWRFTLRGAELADLAYDGEPVLRAIRFVTRDHDWRTADDIVHTQATDTDADSTSGRLRIEASARYDGTEVLRYVLEVTVDGPILHVDAVGTTTTPFRRNRIGLVVLHPPTLAGVPFTARHPSGTATAAAFPTWIAPHQPAADLSGLDWSTGRVALTLDLAGDVFETEDQRNWTDASFKTYSTPLSEPFPVALDAGSVVRQSLTLRATTDDRPGGTASPAPDLTILDGPAPTAVVAPPPTLQLLAASAPAAGRPTAAPLEVPVLAEPVVLVEPVLGDPNVRAVLASARRDAGGGPLDVRFVTDDPDRLRAAIDDVLDSGAVVRIGAFDPTSHVTTPALQQALRDAAAAAGDLEVVAGTRAHFTELNRTVDLFRDWDGPLTFSVTPQMHDRSPEQVTESIRMQRWVVMSASRLAAGRALHVGPVTLRPRFNAVATSARPVVTDATVEAGYGPQFVADATDPAQHSAAARAWFAASVKALTVPGVASITLAEAWGPRGGRLPG
ncbi:MULTISPECIES: hypothetical protein [unclassified Curtobacterium]|uniref:hypothetical protein n=1 Tax=unclassified Curtobacterium TaxID=257496 RepID=UPI001042E2A0|nr:MULTISPECIES: hypothetical protein [unclassified Curtobacterium]TCL71696.1 hypothetical protein EDF23_11411 [Curtobacterium sp. PhB128]TCL90274.1 hypothetical protein EDF29_11451 [Curtobacterium sp. PhB138]